MTRGARWENRLQILLMLAVGAVAAAASWSHVIALAAGHGQAGWLAIADAAVIESAAISAGLEMRRRTRIGKGTLGVMLVLVLAVGLQLAAQLAAAERSTWGWILGAVPCVAFLVLAKLGLSRVGATEGQSPTVDGAINPTGLAKNDNVNLEQPMPPHPLVGLDVAELLAEVDEHLAAEAARAEGERAAEQARRERDEARAARTGLWAHLADALQSAGRRPSDDQIRAWLRDEAETGGAVPGRAYTRGFWRRAPGSQRIDELRQEVEQARAEQASESVPETAGRD